MAVYYIGAEVECIKLIPERFTVKTVFGNASNLHRRKVGHRGTIIHKDNGIVYVQNEATDLERQRFELTPESDGNYYIYTIYDKKELSPVMAMIGRQELDAEFVEEEESPKKVEDDIMADFNAWLRGEK